MKAICYRNTKIILPNWVPNSRLNEECPLGFAYEDGNFYVHIYGMGEGFYIISPGITAIEGKKAGLSLNQWGLIDLVQKIFNPCMRRLESLTLPSGDRE